MPINKKKATPIIDSRHIKVLSAKRKDLKDALVFICLNQQKFGHVDKARLAAITKQIDSIEPDGIYFPMLYDMKVEIYDRSEFNGKDLIVVIRHGNKDSEVDLEEIEESIYNAVPNAKSISFIHEDAEFIF